MTQKERILAMLRAAPERTVSCSEFQKEFLFHKLASRASELKREGYYIRYLPGPTTMEGRYKLVHDKGEGMIEPKDICGCGHLENQHKVMERWSNAANQMVVAQFCTASRCKCHHFQPTTFVPGTGVFKEKEKLPAKPKEEQMEMF